MTIFDEQETIESLNDLIEESPSMIEEIWAQILAEEARNRYRNKVKTKRERDLESFKKKKRKDRKKAQRRNRS